ncbi:TIGR04283 family arsenosugar biosynthesis glycosyltransferase [Sungkyunkwania multivorans]|uniref:TIGR04283 family arsenosugar biosynthesis glycosyltransferase n=1 Tax=Sungkyunkwania multivorans TaxID=1173618 RepID=A0ABW3D0F5_9FLAO
MKISIVIPILNEVSTIETLLIYLLKNSSDNYVNEIIVVDGGSVDGSQEIVSSFVNSLLVGQTGSAFSNKVGEKKYREVRGLDTISVNTEITPRRNGIVGLGPDIQIISAEKGRAKQMNVGARAAKGDVLYFLHADSVPPKYFDKAIIDEISNGASAGCFRMKFDSDHPFLRFCQWFTRFNVRGCRGGDQSLFIKKSLFETMDGFDETYRIYEDCEFIGRLYDIGSFTVIPDYVTTSARKYEKNGTWRLQYHFTVIHLKKFFGASPERLYKYYVDNITS